MLIDQQPLGSSGLLLQCGIGNHECQQYGGSSQQPPQQSVARKESRLFVRIVVGRKGSLFCMAGKRHTALWHFWHRCLHDVAQRHQLPVGLSCLSVVGEQSHLLIGELMPLLYHFHSTQQQFFLVIARMF